MQKDIFILLKKEIKQEWRQRYAIQGVLLYLASTIFICYISFHLKSNTLNPTSWNALFWIISLFISTNAITKSFLQEKEERQLYYYTLTSPQAIILSKIIYNSILLIILLTIGFVFYQLFMGNFVHNLGLFFSILVLAAIGFSSTLTMVAAIASKANNSHLLVPILSFPILIPLLLNIIKVSKRSLEEIQVVSSDKEIGTLIGLNVIVITLSYLLFPYIWRK